jgi:predicted TIM-barrel fold metal-dependent hydrolase
MLEKDGSAEHAMIEHFEGVDWGITRQPVIIAHAGAYDCPLQDFEPNILPSLRRLLSRYPHVMADISGLGFDYIHAVFKHVDGDRLLFGSDALYAPVWKQVVVVMHAFSILGQDAQRGLARIAGTNAAQMFISQKGRQP